MADDDDDEYSCDYSPWMTPRSEEQLFRRDVAEQEAENRRSRLARRVLAAAENRRWAQRMWEAMAVDYRAWHIGRLWR